MGMPDMILCDKGHDVVCYVPGNYTVGRGDKCPLCEAKEALETMEAEADTEVARLEALLEKADTTA